MNSLPSYFLAGVLTLTGGCFLDRSAIVTPRDAGPDADSGLVGLEAGVDAGMDGGDGGLGPGLIPGSRYVPSPLRPAEGSTLPPTRAFLLWQPADIPLLRSLSGYELCRTSGPISEIDGSSECPNASTVALSHAVADPLTAGASVLWKVRARYDDGSFSEWSTVRSFLVDTSVVGRWLFEGDVTDASVAGHDGALQGGAGFAAGFIGQALSLDGLDDNATVADTSDHDFGSGDFWLAAWIHPLRDGAAEALITKRVASDGYELYRSAAGELVFYSVTCGNAATGGSLPINAWHHVAARRAGATVRLYVNGSFVGMGNCAENFSNSGSLTLGNNGSDAGNSEPFEGRIDETILRDTGGDDAAVVNEYCASEAVAGVDPLPPSCQP